MRIVVKTSINKITNNYQNRPKKVLKLTKTLTFSFRVATLPRSSFVMLITSGLRRSRLEAALRAVRSDETNMGDLMMAQNATWNVSCSMLSMDPPRVN